MFINKLWKSRRKRLPYCIAFVNSPVSAHTISIPGFSFYNSPQSYVGSHYQMLKTDGLFIFSCW